MFLAQSTIHPSKVTIRYREDIQRGSLAVGDWLSDVQLHRATSIRIVSAPGAEILNSDEQLNALCYEVARNGSPSLRIEICTSVPNMCMLLDTFSGLFGNNRNLAVNVSRSRLNHHGDMWVPHLMNFLRGAPSLRVLDLGYVATIPEAFQDVITSHPNIEELQFGHDQGISTNHNDLREAGANIIQHGNIKKLTVSIGVIEELPQPYIKALKARGCSMKKLYIGNMYPIPIQIQRQMMRVVCHIQSVKHIAYSNHTLECFFDNSRIQGNVKLLKALTINCVQDNIRNSGNNLKMWKIRSKCFLYPGVFDRWISSIGRSPRADDNDVYGDEGVDPTLKLFEVPDNEEEWLDKKVRILEWITRPDGINEVDILTWTFKFVGYHHQHILVYTS